MTELKEIEQLFPELETNYKYLHEHPELGFEEKMTSLFILEKLAEYGIAGKQIARTGVVATITGGIPGKTVAIRADMDALPISEESSVPYRSKNPERMHACGHDAHVTMLLGAAKYLMANREQLKGNVRLIFQPAEEGTSPETFAAVEAEGGSSRGGAASMIAFGALDQVDACFALHVNPLYPVGTLYVNRDRCSASSDVFELTIKGKGGHGSAPENAIDPMGALAAIITAFNAFPSREVSALDSCSLSIGAIKSGKAWNVIPDSVYITGGLRTFNNELRDRTFKRLEELSDGICNAHRCVSHFVRHEGYAPTVNDPVISEEILQVAQRSFGSDHAALLKSPMMGSEDVGYYFQQVPGAIGWLGAMPEDGPVAPHNPSFKISLDTLKYGVLFHINMAVDYLNK